MNRASRSNPLPRAAARALAAAACCTYACRSPLGGRELDLSVSAQALPGAGAGLALGQRLFDHGTRRIDFELGLERQELGPDGPAGDDWARAWAGLRCGAAEPCAHLTGRAGVTWARSESRAGTLEDPGDYGGAYVGAGWVFEPAPSLATGPELTLLFLDSEGDHSGSGAVAELAWRWTWHL